jgi:hypothetical protein
MTIPANSPWTDELVAALRKGWAAGVTIDDIAARLGVSRNMVAGKARRLGLPMRQGGRPTFERSILVPRWVPPALAADYRELARLDGEEAAASWARNEKRQREARA